MTLKRTSKSALAVGAAVAFLSACGGGGSGADDPVTADISSPAAPQTGAHVLSGKMVAGYQGWFGCPGDFEGNTHWVHWAHGEFKPGNILVDMLPDLEGIAESDQCDTGYPREDGTNVKVFSSQNPRVVDAHFKTMKQNNIHAVAIQRFVSHLNDPHLLRRKDNVLRNAIAAAEKNGLQIYVTYDVSGADPQTVIQTIRDDWNRLSNDSRISGSPAYLQGQGKPVVQFWGFGFTDRPGEAEPVEALIRDFKKTAIVVGGVPAQWRALNADSRSDPAWASTYRSYDIISPWSVGRYGTPEQAAGYIQARSEADISETSKLGIGYQPVIFPGFSWRNLTQVYNKGADTGRTNTIPRLGGQFMWSQIHAHMTSSRKLGHDIGMYVAMFDEVDEATAIMKVEKSASRSPRGVPMVSINQDGGHTLPTDWYLKVTGAASGFLSQRSIPPASLSSVIKPGP